MKQKFKRTKASWKGSTKSFQANSQYSNMRINDVPTAEVISKAYGVRVMEIHPSSFEDIADMCIGIQTANMEFPTWGWAKQYQTKDGETGVRLARINPFTGIANYKNPRLSEDIHSWFVKDEKLGTAKFFIHPRNDQKFERSSFGSHRNNEYTESRQSRYQAQRSW